MPVPTLLPLYTFAKVLGLHPLHFMGVDANIGSAQSRVCIHPITQYSWQDSDGVSREELAQAISEAEFDIADKLGYWPLPTWTPDERIELQDVRPGTWAGTMFDVRRDLISVKAAYGEVISGGRVQKSVVGAAQAVVYTDADTDGYKETATIGPLATTVTDPEEIALYYPGLSGDDEWEIRPITVTIAGGMVTIGCRREQLVVKSLLESLDPATAISGTDDNNFLTTVDIYRKYNDPSVQVENVWRDFTTCGTCSDGCESCALVVQPGCMTVKDKKLGIVTVSTADYDADTEEYTATLPTVCRRPDYVRLWYRSGYRDMSSSLPNTVMAREWQRAIAHLAISKLDRLICSCKGVSDVQAHYNSDLRRSTSTREKSNVYKVTPYELENNPFGTTVAAMDVWRLVRRRSLGLS